MEQANVSALRSITDLHSLHPEHLRLRRPFHLHAVTLLASEFGIKSMDQLMEGHYTAFPVLRSPNIGFPPGSNLPRNLWVPLNRVLTGVGRFGSDICRRGLRGTASYICREENHTAHHIIYRCEDLRPPNPLDDLASPGPAGFCLFGPKRRDRLRVTVHTNEKEALRCIYCDGQWIFVCCQSQRQSYGIHTSSAHHYPNAM